jgi:eukaryotic-like serine/threonine-protein kinase
LDLRPGDVVFGPTQADQYEIIRPIGSGSFGIVYEVHDENKTRFALKTIITAWVNDTVLQALANEGRLATEVNHENVLRIFYFHDGRQYPHLPPYMLMEYADGGTLDTLLSERRKQQRFFDASELQALFTQLASGMKAINEKLVHRDIKPDNILLHNHILKISDFGLSKIVGVATRTQTFKGINHMRYCAPEAWRLEKNLPAMDMYSMGIVFYEIATLQYPYEVRDTGDIVEVWKNIHLLQVPADPRTQNSSLDLGSTQLIMKMISKRPEDRYASWDEVLQRLATRDTRANNTRDVHLLVERAIESRRQAEQERLLAEEKAKKQKEHEDLVSFSFGEILKAAQETIEAFNQASEFIKLKISASTRFGFSIFRSDTPRVKVQIDVRPLAEPYSLDGKAVKAWGYAKAPSGKGFNFVLVATHSDDLYGQWRTMHVKHSAFGNPRDNRPEPFPFEFDELPKEIHLLNAIHIYDTNRDSFEPKFFDPLIAELM